MHTRSGAEGSAESLTYEPVRPSRRRSTPSRLMPWRARGRGNRFILVQPGAELVVEVFSEAGRERFFYRELVVAAPVRPALGSQEQDGARVLAVEAVGEVEPVGDEEHLDLGVEQGADDLVADLGSFALVGPGEGFVEQHEAVRPDMVSDGAHAPQFVVQPPAGHAGIFFP